MHSQVMQQKMHGLSKDNTNNSKRCGYKARAEHPDNKNWITNQPPHYKVIMTEKHHGTFAIRVL